MSIVDNLINTGSQASAGGGGGDLNQQFISRGQSDSDSVTALNTTFTKIDLPTLIGSNGSSITWDDVNNQFEINQDGAYILFYQAVGSAATTNQIDAAFFRDTGSGPVKIDGTFGSNKTVNFGARNSASCSVILVLNSGDKIELRMADPDSQSAISFQGTHCSIVRII